MGILDDIRNMKPLPEKKWTLEELLKIEKEILKKSEKSLIKVLRKNDNIKFINRDKPMVIDFDRMNDYYKNKDRYYCDIDLSNVESSELIYIRKNFNKLSIEGLNYDKSRIDISKNNDSVIIKCSNGVIITINKYNINDFIITDDDVSKIVEQLKKEML